MHEPQIVTFAVHNVNLPYWEALNKEHYFSIVGYEVVNDMMKRITVQYDTAYLGLLLPDMFHAGVKCGMTAIIESQKKLK